jgi:hypothetical protein
MGWLSIEVRCDKCSEVYGVLVDREKRNESQPCERCDGGTATRVWSVPNVSVSKLSASIPDKTAAGRFDVLRRGQEINKELAKAKRAYAANPSSKNAEEVKRTRKEKEKFSGTK